MQYPQGNAGITSDLVVLPVLSSRCAERRHDDGAQRVVVGVQHGSAIAEGGHPPPVGGDLGRIRLAIAVTFDEPPRPVPSRTWCTNDLPSGHDRSATSVMGAGSTVAAHAITAGCMGLLLRKCRCAARNGKEKLDLEVAREGRRERRRVPPPSGYRERRTPLREAMAGGASCAGNAQPYQRCLEPCLSYQLCPL